ncbi:hypothetical protein [Microbacterium sp. NPDC087665]|uniref:hypothetical protein n=1 Tax=Microbacterium sp. NPDC087665 TaxID=3364194 RepID=UPI00382FA254
MNGILHLGALLPAAIGVGALVGMRRDAGLPEILAAALMLAGMTDAMTVSLLPPVVWFAVLLAAGLILAGARRRMPIPTARPGSMLSTHLALGVVTTATLILLMPTMSSSAIAVMSPSHAHGAGGGSAMTEVLTAGLALGSVVLAVVALRAERSWLHRIHHSTMCLSTVAMCAIVMI